MAIDIQGWKVQQAYPLEKYPIADGQRFYLSQKLNGVRCSYLNGQLISRQGKTFQGFQYILDYINVLQLGQWFLDGELIRLNTNWVSDNENFRVGTGIINSQQEEKPGFCFVIFDMMPAWAFAQDSQELYSVRYQRLQDLKDAIDNNKIPCLAVVDHFYAGTDQNQIEHWLRYADENDMEGCMINLDMPYRKTRNRGILKVKSFKSCDIPCVEVFEGEGKYAGMLGGVIALYKGNRLGVGTGFNDDQRWRYWQHPEEIVGHIIMVKYKEESTNKKDGNLSVQFPVFECVRELGKSESYN